MSTAIKIPALSNSTFLAVYGHAYMNVLLLASARFPSGQVEKQDTSGNERERECESETVDYGTPTGTIIGNGISSTGRARKAGRRCGLWAWLH